MMIEPNHEPAPEAERPPRTMEVPIPEAARPQRRRRRR